MSSALPPPTQIRHEESSSTSLPTTGLILLQNHVTSSTTPMNLPTTTSMVDETSLPYLLTQIEDGSWIKVEHGWKMYGRFPGVQQNEDLANNGDISTAAEVTKTTTSGMTTATFVIEQALPSGWGVSSNRSSFYKVPLIVVSSVILAVAITAAIIFITWSRRKAHRKRKRRAERLRRKTLVAAGINPDDTTANVAETALRDKLAELENHHKTRQNRQGGSYLVRTKIRGWRAGLRKRKGKQTSEGMGVVEEDKPVEGVNEVVVQDLDQTSNVPSAEEPQLNDSTSPSPHLSGGVEPENVPEGHPIEPDHPFFLPAYRPASVQSGPPPHSSSNQQTATDVVSGAVMDKTSVPGYYPAPTTAESEMALAVVSTADGKRRLPLPNLDVEEGNRTVVHIATDDKTELERLRLGGSAPPLRDSSSETEGAGPSAPGLEVDEEGFERVDREGHMEMGHGDNLGTVVEGRRRIVSGEEKYEGVPPPPLRITPKVLETSDVGLGSHEHPLPSAPPILAPLVIASAPPLLEVEEGVVPSAPPMEEDDTEEGEEAQQAAASQNGRGRQQGGEEVSQVVSESNRYSSESTGSITSATGVDDVGAGGDVSGDTLRMEDRGRNVDRGVNGKTDGVYLPKYEP
ncbi:hypothetical protein TREMEDRAFT_68945 [Tremella mesenterica DSM 1558]|uniref:uncharacterized protein n=1 Tax=Tremella mesenterica (strain ATCC 24925 / CBS 8224 / DSM 1558 / NBRC 9311 / NRRL Y-6157 / RJB 2259-6 / UBC 559-6) TaxID=578456 RepID=UPI0003F49694|nr:uncharacterized protein TREMEDRAFT_68945 [Tremella mesenterica DSM 1558]EIW69064.1 hypothetical protein TREMEDRAFT_68945 [Tremella mesenterica DSM 1558]